MSLLYFRCIGFSFASDDNKVLPRMFRSSDALCRKYSIYISLSIYTYAARVPCQIYEVMRCKSFVYPIVSEHFPSVRKASGERAKPAGIFCEPVLTSNIGVWSQGVSLQSIKRPEPKGIFPSRLAFVYPDLPCHQVPHHL